MTVQWFTPRDTTRWISKSVDGYYAIAPNEDCFEAFNIPQLWATPKRIGLGLTLAEAHHICEEHRLQVPSRCNA